VSEADHRQQPGKRTPAQRVGGELLGVTAAAASSLLSVQKPVDRAHAARGAVRLSLAVNCLARAVGMRVSVIHAELGRCPSEPWLHLHCAPAHVVFVVCRDRATGCSAPRRSYRRSGQCGLYHRASSGRAAAGCVPRNCAVRRDTAPKCRRATARTRATSHSDHAARHERQCNHRATQPFVESTPSGTTRGQLSAALARLLPARVMMMLEYVFTAASCTAYEIFPMLLSVRRHRKRSTTRESVGLAASSGTKAANNHARPSAPTCSSTSSTSSTSSRSSSSSSSREQQRNNNNDDNNNNQQPAAITRATAPSSPDPHCRCHWCRNCADKQLLVLPFVAAATNQPSCGQPRVEKRH
jgi:hypothetical protein